MVIIGCAAACCRRYRKTDVYDVIKLLGYSFGWDEKRLFAFSFAENICLAGRLAQALVWFCRYAARPVVVKPVYCWTALMAVTGYDGCAGWHIGQIYNE